MKHNRHTKGFTLVEIMIVVAILVLLAVLGIPSFLSARQRSQASICINNLRQIDGTKNHYALENGNSVPALTDMAPDYIKKIPICPAGGTYSVGTLDNLSSCSLGGTHSL